MRLDIKYLEVNHLLVFYLKDILVKGRWQESAWVGVSTGTMSIKGGSGSVFL